MCFVMCGVWYGVLCVVCSVWYVVCGVEYGVWCLIWSMGCCV